MILDLLHCHEEFSARMSIKIYFLSYYFSYNCGDYSEVRVKDFIKKLHYGESRTYNNKYAS